jgi:putative ABC transport system permease protein
MSSLPLILASLLHHWRMNFAVAAGVAVGTAVLTGALLVGDCMRESLRHLTLDRLGRIDQALVSERFFRAELSDELATKEQFVQNFSSAAPVILLNASLQQTDRENRQSPARADHVNLLGCDPRFWQLDGGGPKQLPGPGQIVLNQALAEQLGAVAGDDVLLWLPRPGLIPGDSPLGKKNETLHSHRMRVSEVIPTDGLGRFGLRPTQQLPRNAYVSLEWLQEQLRNPGQVNAILVAGKYLQSKPLAGGDKILQQLLKPSAADYGLKVQQSALGYINITCDTMLIHPKVENAVWNALGPLEPSSWPSLGTNRRIIGSGDEIPFSIQPALTYLAITIACGDKEIPYSTITAINLGTQPPLGPWLTPEGTAIQPLTGDQIVLNAWAAKELDAKVGDVISVTYFEPESVQGQLHQKTAEFHLAAIAQMAGAADDRALTPAVAGLTEQSSMRDWDAPFPFDGRRIKPRDEQYWKQHGATPKAFVPLATGRRLWGGRFGQTTSIRVRPTPGMTAEGLEAKLALDPAAMGFVFQPVKAQGLAASAGTTPFNLLFLGFSFFIIAAAVMLVVLMFRLGIDRRAAQIGILLAVGIKRAQVTGLFAAEGLLVAALGSLLGVAAGVAYAALMLLGLRTWWVEAVTTPFLRLYVSPASPSLAIGYVSGLAVAFIAIAWSVRRIGRIAPHRLLAGQTTREIVRPAHKRAAGSSKAALHKRTVPFFLILVSLAPVVPLLLISMNEEVQAVVFFAAGAFVLAIWLLLSWIQLHIGAARKAVRVGRGNLARLALRNAGRNPGRSALCIGLIASACFLIVAVSAFRLDPTQQTPTLNSGNGGFALAAESDQPIFNDPNTREGLVTLAFSDSEIAQMQGTKTILFRVKPGDDASCLNLYRPGQPRVLGVPRSLIDRGGFAWAAAPRDSDNPWRLLADDMPPDADGIARVPVVMDKNTAAYSLHLGGPGSTYDITDGSGQTVRLVVAALLDDSIFQGDLLIDEEAFLRCFPEMSGYRFFLVQTPPGKAAEVAAVLQRLLGSYGLSVETTGRRLAEFLAVQNTYLSTFQSLGGLGLLLGTIGLAAVQLRGVLERRGELALLRAAGFRRRKLAIMVMIENALLLAAGLGIGVLAALVAVLPHMLYRTAAIPWKSLTLTLAAVLLVGLLSGLAAVRAVLRAPLLPALREEH